MFIFFGDEFIGAPGSLFLQSYQNAPDDGNDRSEPIIPMHGFMEIQNTPQHPKYSQTADSHEPWLEK
jgi:hypothetical protein